MPAVDAGFVRESTAVNISTQSTGDRRLTPSQREALGKFQAPPVALSSRQMAILHYLAQGESNKEIAYRLAIAQPTVSFHIAELRRKLDVPNNRKIVERAQELKLL